MKKKLTYVLATTVLSVALLAGCGKADEAATETAVEATSNEAKVYESKDGWSVHYNPEVITVNESEEAVSFVYTGESAGTNMVEISYIKDKQPMEVLSEKFEGDPDYMKAVSEGFFGNNSDLWSYRVDTQENEDGSGLNESYIAAEYNGGVIYFQRTGHNSGDEEMDMAVSDSLAEIADSFELKDFQPQTELAYVVGDYSLTAEAKNSTFTAVSLKDDHTGTLTGDSGSVDVIWESKVIRESSSDKTYEYTVEGDYLYLNIDDEFVEYSKSGVASASSSDSTTEAAKEEKSDDAAVEAETPSGDVSYEGTYVEPIAGRGTITVTKDGELYMVEIAWANGAAEMNTWTFAGKIDANGVLEYANCLKVVTTFDEEGNDNPKEEYNTGTGRLKFADGSLTWEDDQENAGSETEFVKQ